MRTLCAVVCLLCACCLLANADLYTFEITNTQGNVPGSVSGTILLPDGDGANLAATEVTVEAYPAYFMANGYPPPPLYVMSWPEMTGFVNRFTVQGGQVTAAQFYRNLNATDYSVSLAFNYANNGNRSNYLAFFDWSYGVHGGDGEDQLVWGPWGLSGAGIQPDPPAAVPELGSIILFGTVMLGSARTLLRRIR